MLEQEGSSWGGAAGEETDCGISSTVTRCSERDETGGVSATRGVDGLDWRKPQGGGVGSSEALSQQCQQRGRWTPWSPPPPPPQRPGSGSEASGGQTAPGALRFPAGPAVAGGPGVLENPTGERQTTWRSGEAEPGGAQVPASRHAAQPFKLSVMLNGGAIQGRGSLSLFVYSPTFLLGFDTLAWRLLRAGPPHRLPARLPCPRPLQEAGPRQ